MDKSEGGEFYYSNKLVGGLEWQNSSYKTTDSDLQSFKMLQFFAFYIHIIAISWVGQLYLSYTLYLIFLL